MKVNIQKVIKCVTCLVTCFVLVLGAVCPRASALSFNAYELSDYITDIEIVDGIKYISYDVVDIVPYMCCWQYIYGSVDFFGYNSPGIDWQLDQDADDIYFGVFPLGSRIRDGYDLVDGDAVLDISDILPGSPIQLSSRYVVAFEPRNQFDDFEFHYSGTMYYFMYDSDGKFIGKQKHYIGSEVLTDLSSYTWEWEIENEFTFPYDCAYICPFLHIYCYDNMAQTGYSFRFTLESYDLNFYTAFSYIEENSASMNVIKEQLGDINDSLGSIEGAIHDNFEGLGDTIDNATDEILSGTPEQNDKADGILDDAASATDKFNDAKDAANDYEKPTVSSDVISVDKFVSEADLSDFTAPFLELWKLDVLKEILVLVVTLAMVSFVFFGKKG